MRSGPARIGAILASALLLALFARVELPWAWLGWVALVPWLAGLDREQSMRAVVLSGVAMSAAFAVGVFGWFADAFARYTATPLGVSYALLLVTAPILQPQLIAFAAARHAIRNRTSDGLAVSITAASVWIAVEWISPRLLGDTLGHGLLPFSTFRQGADLAGAPGLTFALLVVNQELLAVGTRWRSSRGRAFRALAVTAAVMCTLAGYGVLRLHQIRTWSSPRSPIGAVLVQASLEDYGELRRRVGTFSAVRGILDSHMTLSRQAVAESGRPADVGLIVWPETVYPTTFGTPKSSAGADLDAAIVQFAEDTGTATLFGTYDRDDRGEYNAAVLLQPQSDGPTLRETYRKRRLFPMTETVPAWLDHGMLRERLPWLGTWLPGNGPPLLELHRDGDDIAVAPLICLDAVDPGLALDAARHGADLIVAVSNDGWFADGGGARLHLTVSAFRSIETRLPQLRATNSGISAVIDADGEITSRSAIGQSTTVTTTVTPGQRGQTLMMRWGNWFGPAACLLALLFVVPAFKSRRLQ